MSLLKTSELTGFLNKVLKQNGQLRTGQNLKYHCPFCHHVKKKLEIHIEPPYEYNCWTCHVKGRGFFTLLKKINAPKTWYSELEKIVGEQRDFTKKLDFNKPLICFDGPIEEDDPELDLPIEFKSLTINDGSRSYRQALNYSRKRKIGGADIIKYNIGYCSDGPYRDRLVFPSYDKENKLNFFSCRSYYDDIGFKYMNSPFSKNIIGFENMVDFDYPIYLSEGALDAISLKRNAIPLFGKTLSPLLKTTIIESKCPEVNIVLDDDALQSSLYIADFIHSIGKVAKLIQLQGKDPNVLGFEKTHEQARETERLDFTALMRLRLNT